MNTANGYGYSIERVIMRRNPSIKKLLTWFEIHGRKLPWRFIDDPYLILVSEIMLQQTQVARVIEYYQAWIKRFPNWQSLAEAKTPELLRAWSGLGYNRRALYLRDAARHVVEHGIPTTEADWRNLKGVGNYTASAVYAFTQKTPSPAVDTNIRRVVGRFSLGIPYPTLAQDSRIRKKLHGLFSHKNDWIAIHALMDLGSAICTPKEPRCSKCPLRSSCPAKKKLLKNPKRVTQKMRERTHEGKRFADRIYRGKALKYISDHEPVTIDEIGIAIDPTYSPMYDRAWLLRIIDRMKKDGFIEERNESYFVSR